MFAKETDDGRKSKFSNPTRGVIAAVLIFLSLGHIVGRILAINSINHLSLEQTLRFDLSDELKYLFVMAVEQSNTDHQTLYADALKKEFQFDAQKLRDPAAARAAKNAKEKATRRWPIETRRQNWESRKSDLMTDALVKKVIAETKYRRQDLIDELKYLAVEAIETNDAENLAIYEQAIRQVSDLIAQDKDSRKSELNTEAVALSPFDSSELRDPASIKRIKEAKQKRTHHWPIEIRRRDTERMKERFSEKELVKFAILETNKQRPFLSGNDRSRWLTVRSLVEYGTYEINELIENEPAWDSVDVVSHMNANGEQRLYSSKPPLQATLVAGPYWLIHKLTGYSLGSHPFEVGRFLLVLVNVFPLGLAWWWCARLLDEWCETDAGYVISLAAICFATMISTFAVALNNHLWGAVAGVGTSWYATRCWRGSERWWDYAGAGFWGAFLFSCELPAASFMAFVGLLMLCKSPRLTLTFGVPAAAIVLLSYFGTNYLAHDVWRPPYSYGAGDVNTEQSKQTENWYDYDWIRWIDGKKVDSYWRSPNNPLDLGEKSTKHYVFHSLIGHHGVFSLTPLLLLGLPGMLIWAGRGSASQRPWAWALLGTTLVCMIFYLFLLDVRQRNYGGTTIAFRQLLWLHPLWILSAASVTDRMWRSKLGQWSFGVLAALSMISVSYATWNPWSQNWIWNLMVWLGLNPLSQ